MKSIVITQQFKISKYIAGMHPLVCFAVMGTPLCRRYLALTLTIYQIFPLCLIFDYAILAVQHRQQHFSSDDIIINNFNCLAETICSNQSTLIGLLNACLVFC